MPRKDDNPSPKLKMKKSGPSLVVAVTTKTVAIEKDGINDTVSFERVSIARRMDETGSPPQPHTEDEYVADKTVGHSVANGK